MPAYAFSTFAVGSEIQPLEGRTIVRASNGAAKLRVLHASDKVAFDLVHEMTPAQKATLDSNYSSNRTGTVDVTWDGTIYTCVYARPPQSIPQPGGWYIAKVRLEQV